MDDQQRRVDVDGSLTIHGDFILGDQFNNHQVRGSVGPFIPVKVAEDEKKGWQGGADVTVAARTYLLDEQYLAERSLPDVVHREARALERSSRAVPRSRYVWLRQVSVREPTATARRALDGLRGERDLLTGRGGRARGLPRLLGFETAPDGRTATLVVTWPSVARFGPGRTLDTLRDPDGGPMGEAPMVALFKGLAGLCDTLAALHRRGCAHRSLSPAGIVIDRGGLVLRDLGLAALPPEVGEEPVEYRAPEQCTRLARPPGANTDVYQVAALAYHLLTGQRPAFRAPLPIGRLAPGLPERAGRDIDAALDVDPPKRPDAGRLGTAFRAAHDDLSRGNDDVSPCPPPGAHYPRPE